MPGSFGCKSVLQIVLHPLSPAEEHAVCKPSHSINVTRGVYQKLRLFRAVRSCIFLPHTPHQPARLAYPYT
eukprot:753676-Hanusia_phi.AAC.19